MKQADDWHRAGQLRAYVETMRAKAVTLISGEEREAASAWIEWASGFTDRLDPLSGQIAMRPEIEAKPGTLQPFMPGRNAYAPPGS